MSFVPGHYEEYSRITLVNPNDVEDKLRKKEPFYGDNYKQDLHYNKDSSDNSKAQSSEDEKEENVDESIPSISSSAKWARSTSAQTVFPDESQQYITYFPKKTQKIHPTKTIKPETTNNSLKNENSHKLTPSNLRKKYHGKINDINHKVISKSDDKISSKSVSAGSIYDRVFDDNISRADGVSEKKNSRQSDGDGTQNSNLSFERDDDTCQLLIGYKSIDGVADIGLMNNWLKWSGTWDAYTMMQEESLQVQNMSM